MTCKICGTEHGDHKCFLIKAFEYYPDGTLKRVEYLTPADLKQQGSQLDNIVAFGTRQ